MAFFWALESSSWFPGILGAEVENVLLTGGKIGMHMLLRALPRDSTMRLSG
jgi:hypothetical protein